MAGDFEITGQDQFRALARKINAQGSAGRGLWRELNTALNDAAEPMVDEVKNHLSKYFPNRYARILQPQLKVRLSRSTRGNGVALKLVGTAKGRGRNRRLGTMNRGTLRHPVFHMSTWVDQRITPGFWDEPLENAREIPAQEIRRAVQRTIRKMS